MKTGERVLNVAQRRELREVLGLAAGGAIGYAR
jgi:hypothetical protein